MEAPQPKKKLPFKRTIQRKSADTPKDDDDGLALFSHSNDFFPTVIEDRQREAAEKAAKAEKERREKEEREQKKKERALQDQQRLLRSKEKDREELPLTDDDAPSATKRRRISPPSVPDDNDDDVFTISPRRSRKPSIGTPRSSSAKHDSLGRESATKTPRSTRNTRASRARTESSAAITLDSDQEETKDAKSPLDDSFSPPGRRSASAKKRQDSLEEIDLEVDASGGGQGGGSEENGDDAFNRYIQGARERAEKRKREREASASGGTPTGSANPEPVVQILVSSVLPGIQPIVFKRKLGQPLAVVQKTWVEQQLAKKAPLTRAELEKIFFTWRGAKVYPHTTLETLGIRPSEADGSLYSHSHSTSSWTFGKDGTAPEGYHDRDKVHFEAWEQSVYEAHMRQRERERLRARGELLSDDEDAGGPDGADAEDGGEGSPSQQQQQKEKKEPSVRIILKASNMDTENIKVRPSTTISMLIMVFKRLKKLPADKTVELHWDGEVLDPDSTIADAEIEDLDSIEVHVK